MEYGGAINLTGLNMTRKISLVETSAGMWSWPCLRIGIKPHFPYFRCL